MSLPVNAPSHYADFQGLESLKASARANEDKALRETARQFESLFTHMILKAMREASQSEGMGDSEDVKFYQDMYDQQLAVQMSKGNGLGLATRLIEQLTRASAVRPAEGPTPAPASAPATIASDSSSTNQRAEFVQRIRPQAEQVAARLGVATESVIAQAALETGWGRSIPADSTGSSNNLFGIKANSNWQGARVASLTQEHSANGMRQVVEPFRAYRSVAESVSDYADLLGNSRRYAAVRNTGQDVHAFATALKRGGYATDPDYVQKIVATADSVRRLLAVPALKSSGDTPIASGQIG